MKELTMYEVEQVGGGVNWGQLCAASSGLFVTTAYATVAWPNPVTATAAAVSGLVQIGSCTIAAYGS